MDFLCDLRKENLCRILLLEDLTGGSSNLAGDLSQQAHYMPLCAVVPGFVLVCA